MVNPHTPKQYEILLIDLDPTKGVEIKKMRPCLVVSPDEMNRNIQTIIIAPLTTKSHGYPSRVPINFHDKSGWIVLDQLRAVDKSRIEKYLGKIDERLVLRVKETLKEIFVD